MCIFRTFDLACRIVYVVSVCGPVDEVGVLLAGRDESDEVGCRRGEGCTVGRVVECIAIVNIFATEVGIVCTIVVCIVATLHYKNTAFGDFVECRNLVAKFESIFGIGKILDTTCCDTYSCRHVLSVYTREPSELEF